ncbi:bifunctional 5,10-methylenetetrahydrofolate dehydrogenase/5,10-methenyltetrahydrofolate cyclohydrolase [Halocalculus aciditolerans]|nr:tetrahydrofolate dehydrogenase/cyclohydrolase catalytic domain-containing protein [Halocalculus aciditolerans]
MTTVIDGNAVAEDVRADVAATVDALDAEGVTPGLATVLMSDDDASSTYVSMKQRDCEEVGIESFHVEIDPDEPASELYETIDDLNAREDVHGILVQLPLPDHVDEREVLRRVDPAKDVDGFHPENVGRLVAGDPRFVPCTPNGVMRLLDDADVPLDGLDATVVGRSNIVGKPLSNLLLQENATVTTCHSRTTDLEAHTRSADLVVAAAGIPEFIDASMLAEGAVVIDVGTNRVEDSSEKGYHLTGDVDFESAKEKASVISPSPGGVGPMTRAMLLVNTVEAAAALTDSDVPLP